MVALNFPSSPVDGDTYAGYTYNGTVGAWQWDVVSPVIPKSGNAIINGDFGIWQRGTSFSNSSDYAADRWMALRSALATGLTASRQAVSDSTNLPNFRYCARVQRDSGNSATNPIFLAQSIETDNSIRFAGQEITVSFYARAGANYSASGSNIRVLVKSGTGVDQNGLTSPLTGEVNVINQDVTLTTTWQRFSLSGTVDSDITQLYFHVQAIPTGTAGADDWFEITGVQLEAGPVATPFKLAGGGSKAAELGLCQRYLQAVGSAGNYTVANGFCSSTTQARVVFPSTTTMRTTPSVDFGSTSVADIRIAENGGQETATILTVVSATPSRDYGHQVAITVASGLTANHACGVFSTGGTIYFDAEL